MTRTGAVRPQRPLLVMIIGPSGGTAGQRRADPPVLLAAARQLYAIGHVPVVTTELARAWTGPDAPPDPAAADTLSKRLLVRCDAMLRLGGRSAGADQMVRLASWEGKPVYYRVDDVPAVSP